MVSCPIHNAASEDEDGMNGGGMGSMGGFGGMNPMDMENFAQLGGGRRFGGSLFGGGSRRGHGGFLSERQSEHACLMSIDALRVCVVI